MIWKWSEEILREQSFGKKKTIEGFGYTTAAIFDKDNVFKFLKRQDDKALRVKTEWNLNCFLLSALRSKNIFVH